MTAHKDLIDPDVHEPKGISDATSGQIYMADGAGSGAWTSLSTITIPVGMITDYAGSSAPSGWLLCYGQAISRTTYASLFAAISTTYGSGDGSTTFNVPDIRGRVTAGQDDMGGSSANRLTNQSGGLNGDTLGATGGSETHTLTEAELAAHDHGATGLTASSSVSNGTNVVRNLDNGDFGDTSVDNGNQKNVFDSVNASESTIAVSTTISGDTADAGSGSAHNNVQPTIILNKIIYTGV
jgi:microcystin-dependent protein